MDTDSLLKTYAAPYKYGKAVLEGSGVEGAFDLFAQRYFVQAVVSSGLKG